MKKNLNSTLTIFLYLVILRHIIAIFTSISQLIMAFSGYLSLPVLLWNLAMHVTMIVVLFNILSIKKWAVYAFGGIQIINVAVLTLFFRSDFFTSSFVAVLLCLLLAVLFCLKKDGVSAWRLFFPKIEEKEDDEHACVDEIESVIEEKDVEETFVPELSVYKENEEKKIRKSKTSMIQDDDLFKSLETLPLKEDGSIDYEQMSTIQQFAYTYKTESLQVALIDLNADIKVLEKSIAKVKKELSSLSGGNRAKLRDSLREEQVKLDELYGLCDKYSVRKKWDKKYFLKVCFSIFLLCILSLIGYIVYSNGKVSHSEQNVVIKQLESIHWNDVDDINVYVKTSYKDDLSQLYSALIEKGYTKEILGNEDTFAKRMCDAENRKMFFNYVKGRNDFKIGGFDSYEKRVLLSLDRRWLYIKLSGKYDLGEYCSYFENMNDENKRKNIYHIAVDEGFDVGTWKEFNDYFSY